MMLDPSWALAVPAALLLAVTAIWSGLRWSATSAAGRGRLLLRLLATVAALVVTLHPVGAHRVDQPVERATDVIVVMDRTTSMGAQDYHGHQPRMTGAVADVTAVLRAVAGSRVAIVVFDDDARVAVPFTTDTGAAVTFIETMGWRPSSKASGSDIGVAATLTEELLQRAATERPEHHRYLLYVGDGEQTATAAPDSFASSRALLDGALVLGYGTTHGGPMAADDDPRKAGELIRIDGQVQLSRTDPEALRAIAGELGGSYVHRAAPGTPPAFVPPAAAESRSELVAGREYYWWLALGAAAGLLVLLGAAAGALRVAHEEVADAGR